MADLWIRSQDREMLCKVECVELMHDDPEYAKIFLNGQFPDLIVGAYGKERALEVLDEIQSILSDEVVVFKNFSFNETEDLKKLEQIIGTRCIAIQDNTDTVPTVDFKNKNRIVYSMPKE